MQSVLFVGEAAHQITSLSVDPPPAGFNHYHPKQVVTCNDPPTATDITRAIDCDEFDRRERERIHAEILGRHPFDVRRIV